METATESFLEDSTVDPSYVLRLVLRLINPTNGDSNPACMTSENTSMECTNSETGDTECTKSEARDITSETNEDNDDAGDPKVEACCVLWDLAMNPSVVKYLAKNQFLDILATILQWGEERHSGRFLEVCIGVLGNMAIVDDVCVQITECSELIDALMTLFFCSIDPPMLTEITRLLTVGISCSRTRTFWLRTIGTDQGLGRVLWILGNTLNADLLSKLCALVEMLFFYDDAAPDAADSPQIPRKLIDLGVVQITVDLLHQQLDDPSVNTATVGAVVDLVAMMAASEHSETARAAAAEQMQDAAVRATLLHLQGLLGRIIAEYAMDSPELAAPACLILHNLDASAPRSDSTHPTALAHNLASLIAQDERIVYGILAMLGDAEEASTLAMWNVLDIACSDFQHHQPVLAALISRVETLVSAATRTMERATDADGDLDSSADATDGASPCASASATAAHHLITRVLGSIEASGRCTGVDSATAGAGVIPSECCAAAREQLATFLQTWAVETDAGTGQPPTPDGDT